MRLSDALKLLPRTVVIFRDREDSSTPNRTGLGIVRMVTQAGRVLVSEYDMDRPTVALNRDIWIPYNRIDGHLAARPRPIPSYTPS